MNPGFLCDSPVINSFSDNSCLLVTSSLIGSNDGPGATLMMMSQDHYNQSDIRWTINITEGDAD